MYVSKAYLPDTWGWDRHSAPHNSLIVLSVWSAAVNENGSSAAC